MELLEGEREEILNQVSEIVKGYDDNRENLIPILQKVQKGLGYLPLLAQEKIAEALNIPPVDVYGLATFYNQFRLNPPGKNQVQVCMGTACHMIGGQIIMDSFERKLEIEEGETTSDREFSLERVACVGCCAIAPVVVVNDFVEGNVSPLRVDGIILQLQEGNEDTNSLEGETEDKSLENKVERGNNE
ncbi:MAG: NADH-quinone oxidoreductase subunit NuoE [Candidatus Syntrophonatronum acetioxidans]|uniref:NADH-quinone oxidoreductase subunit NuoE n=1 Tax=Candidatus Syntrophonatronum acetioxidans TaxID=1795816 RepID=A0A424YHG1_9FIRM|nr:MAG: NADH-quinone oxidoreductase subunit NuoE [Candidatus Syntrophonatronum acetioxidans]